MVLIDFRASLLLFISAFPHLSYECSKKGDNRSDAAGNNTGGVVPVGPGSPGGPGGPKSPGTAESPEDDPTGQKLADKEKEIDYPKLIVPPGVVTTPGQPGCVVLPPTQEQIDNYNDFHDKFHGMGEKLNKEKKPPHCRNTWIKTETGTYMVADFNNKCYGGGEKEAYDTFKTQEDECKKKGGYVVEVTSQKEYDIIRSISAETCRTYTREEDCWQCNKLNLWVQTFNSDSCAGGDTFYLNLKAKEDGHFYWRKSGQMLDTLYYPEPLPKPTGPGDCVWDDLGRWTIIDCDRKKTTDLTGFCVAFCEK